jgi:Protein of unknown function (DUF3592)
MSLSDFFKLLEIIVPIVFGILLIYSGFEGLRNFTSLKKNGLTVIGKIVKIQEVEDEGIMYYPTVEFKTLDGITVEGKLDGRSHNRYKKLQEVKVYYDSEDPYNFVIGVKYEHKFQIILFIAIGFGLLIWGLTQYFDFINH